MTSTNQATTFWQFLSKNKIEIPIIQRDYAQGRSGKEKLREKFLSDLKSALDGALPNEQKTLKLDFVYGSDEQGGVNPLDGQQRLTTLWLLHWYVAYKSGALKDRSVTETLKRFTYETRVSSREFCERLAEFTEELPEATGLVEHITNQTWFYSAWKEDPTIRAMLNMLGGTDVKEKGKDITDGLEEIFSKTDKNTFEEYWEKLTNLENPSVNEVLEKDKTTDNFPVTACPILFYYLPLSNFGLSDDLYIKMNARGLQLTDFENFKADLIALLRSKVEGADDVSDADPDGEGTEQIRVTNERWLFDFNAKLDTTWTDIFWKNRSKP